jgi:putative ABC transport system permease protein
MLADTRRFAASVAGVGLALMLILLLDGLSTGIDARVTVYEERSGASLFVGQPGTTSFLGSTSVLPRTTLETVRAQEGVTWAAAVRGFFTVPRINGTSVPSYVVGWEPGQPGGPWAMAAGREPKADDEIAVGQQFAQRCGVALGDTVKLFGRPFKVVGVAADADMFMASFVFMTHRATDLLLNAPLSTSFVLVGTDHPEAVTKQLSAVGITAISKEQIEQNDLALKGQAYSVGLNLMVGVAFVVGTLVIALTIYSAVMERRREYGIIKAIGANSSRLFRLVLSQSLVLAAVGLIVGGLMFVGGQRLLGVVKPQFAITLTGAAVGRVVISAVAMGLLATFIPARRLMAMAPAVAFRGG